MKINEYNEMMAYLTRPARVGFSSGTDVDDFLKRLKEAKTGTGRYSDMSEARRQMLVRSLTGQINVMLREKRARGGVIGKGGMFQGQDMGYRTGYSKLYGPNIKKATHTNSFEVQVNRGGKVYYENFPWSEYGGEKAALQKAEAFRDKYKDIPKASGLESKGRPVGWLPESGARFEIRKILNEFISQGKKDFTIDDVRKKINLDLFPDDQNFRTAVDAIKKEKAFNSLKFIRKARDPSDWFTDPFIRNKLKESYGNVKMDSILKDVFPDENATTSRNRVHKILTDMSEKGEITRMKSGAHSAERLAEFDPSPENIKQLAITKRRQKKIKGLGSEDYEKKLFKFKKKIQEGLGLEKIKSSGRISGKPYFFDPIDMGHQSSITQLKALGEQITPEDLNPQYYDANRKGVRKFKEGVQTTEHILKRDFYPKQKRLFKEAKKFIDAGKNVPDNLQQKILNNNDNILRTVKTVGLEGRINPITIDPANLNVKRGANVLRTLGIGLVEGPLGDVKIGSMDDAIIKINLAQQILQEATDFDLIDPKVGQGKLKLLMAPEEEFIKKINSLKSLLKQGDTETIVKIRKVLGCDKIAASSGGRIGFQGGGGLLGCPIAKLEADPKGTLSKVAQAVPETRGAIMETLGPDGWRFLDVDYSPTEGRLSRMVGKLPKPIGSPLRAAGSMALSAGRWIFDPLSLGLIPVELAVMGAYNFAQNKKELMKALKDNPMVSEMAKKYKMSAEDVRNAILEKYRRASLATETGLEEQVAFEPKHQKAVDTFDKKFYPFWDPDFQTEGPQKTDTSFVKEAAFGAGVGEHLLSKRAEEEEKERMHRMGIARPDTAFGVEPEVYTKFYTKKEYYPKDYPDKTLAEQLRSTKKIPFEALREGEDPLPEGGFYEGGRVGLKKGTFKPGRRTFLKGIGAGMLVPFAGKFFKFVGKKTAGKLTGPIIQKTAGMPDWFPGLVKRLYQEGDDVTGKLATKDLQVVKGGKLESGDDIHLYHDIDTGDIRVEVSPKKTKTGYGYETESGAFYKPYGAEVKKGETVVNKKTGKTTKTEDEFYIAEEEHVGGPEDVDFDIKETTVDDALSDLTEMEAFAKKKTTKQIHKKKGTRKKDVWPEFDDTIPDEDEFLP